MMKILGYDCDGNELEEYQIVRCIFYADTDFNENKEADPRQYAVVQGIDGKGYLISVLDHWHKKAINRFEGRHEYAPIPIKIMPISEACHYELAFDGDGKPFKYPFDRAMLTLQLNKQVGKLNPAKDKVDFKSMVRLFMIFDILGDTERTGPTIWKVDRKRLEDIKDHVFDLMTMARLMKDYLPAGLDYNKINDYILCHDLPEAITGDITKFEGVSSEEKKRVEAAAIQYLDDKFRGILDIEDILYRYEKRGDLESKIVNMLDRVHSSTTFMKYDCEEEIDVDNPEIIEELRQDPFVVESIRNGMDVGEMFYVFHKRAVSFSDEEVKKYGITRDVADSITYVIQGFMDEFRSQRRDGSLIQASSEFPQKAMIYNRNAKVQE